MDPKFIAKVRLTSQGQVTLPKEAREDLSIGVDSDLYWYEINGNLLLVKELVSQKEISRLLMKKRG